MKKFLLLMLVLFLLQIKPCGMEKPAQGAGLPGFNPRTAPLVLPAGNKYTIMTYPGRLTPGDASKKWIKTCRRNAARPLSHKSVRAFCEKCGLLQLVNGTRQLLKAQ